MREEGVKMANKFSIPVRVYYEDTDAGGIVYYANYLKFAERARTEFIRSLGIRQQDALEQEDSFAFAVRRCEVDYKLPAVLDDLLNVTCVVENVGGSSVEISQEIWRGETLLTSIKVMVVYISLKKKRPVRIPAELVEKLKGI